LFFPKQLKNNLELLPKKTYTKYDLLVYLGSKADGSTQ